jgi:hypothetical protein
MKLERERERERERLMLDLVTFDLVFRHLILLESG